MKKKIAIIGAGKLGKGYAADLFAKAGYHPVFITRRQQQADTLRAQGYYTVCLEHENGAPMEIYRVHDFTAWCSEGPERNQCLQVLAEAEIAVIAIYANGFAQAAALLAEAICLRAQRQAGTLDILLLVNSPSPDAVLDALIREGLHTPAEIQYYEKNIGLVTTLPIRDGFAALPEVLAQDPEAICASDYPELPVDREAFRGEIPAVEGLLPLDKMQTRIRAKLWTSNMRLGAIAGAGVHKGYTVFDDAVRDRQITAFWQACKKEALYAIEHELGMDEEEYRLGEYKAPPLLPGVDIRPTVDVFERQLFGLKRKVSRQERFLGPALGCICHGKLPYHLAKAAALAYMFDNSEDPDSVEILSYVREHGIEAAVYRYSGLDKAQPMEALLAQLVCAHYAELSIQKY